MSFLSRLLVVVGLSFVMTLVLMVIHWEPEPGQAPLTTGTAPSGPVIVLAEYRRDPAEGAQPTRSDFVRDTDAGDWVMQEVDALESLPEELRTALSGCVVPVSSDSPNVIWGELKQAGQTDLAVLCVRDQRAAVYVFWGGEPDAAEIATEVDFIPGVSIRAATADTIRVEVTRDLPLDPGMPHRVRHDGIQLGHGCCATTQYWHRGRWRSYVSAD